jgi:hypothetical protein
MQQQSHHCQQNSHQTVHSGDNQVPLDQKEHSFQRKKIPMNLSLLGDSLTSST